VEIKRTRSDYEQDKELARRLTAEIVAARRDEDKQALASDEAVAHGLSTLRRHKKEGLDSLLDQPYFARVVTEEEGKETNPRLGTASFPKERIIDWRKAPISKLYYDYKEGDDFGEEIQGRDRLGIITLRRSYQGFEDQLNIIEGPDWTLKRQDDGEWAMDNSPAHRSRTASHDGHLPPILSLITPDQFALITKEIDTPLVIQGIAGSGKTTVALHRLAWLMHGDNSGVRPEKCLVVMFNRALKAYVETTLPELKVHDVPIHTFYQWGNQLLNDITGPRPIGSFKKSRELEIFKSSATCLDKLYEFMAQLDSKVEGKAPKDFIPLYFQFLDYLTAQDLFWPKWDVIRQQLKEQHRAQVCDQQDDALILHLIYAEHGYYPTKDPKCLNLLDHIVIDEAQDFGIVEVRALLNALDHERTVTIVGDAGQKIVMGRDFKSWEGLLKEAGFVDTKPIQLTVSHRSSAEIMNIAAHVRQPDPEEREYFQATRHGPIPSFIEADLDEVIPNLIGQWVKDRAEDDPKTYCSIICRWPKQAQALVDALRKLGHSAVRLGHRDQFDFSPGITVTNVHQVKGLEFRNVLMVEPSEEQYRHTSDEERNLLYVGITRAEERLDFVGAHERSTLLPYIPKSMIEEEPETQADDKLDELRD
jgi:DNA helicase II / ATP-dependent DNA helicase PcrA